MRAGFAVAIVVLAVATGALAAPPKEAQFTLDGVEYLYITGVNFTETVVLDPAADATQQLPIESCGFVMLHPGTPNGRIIVHSMQAGGVPAQLYIDQFRLPDGKRGYSYDVEVAEDGQRRLADLVVSGNATLRVDADRYFDPLTSSGIDDLDKDQPDMLGSVLLLREGGVRDDLTGAVLAGEPVDDAELHIHMRSNPEGQARTITRGFASPGMAPPTEAYGASYVVPNLKFGGQASLAITTTTYAPAGMNRLTFSVMSPTGQLLTSAVLEPALLTDDTETLTFPLALFGDYKIVVTGEVALAEYSMTLTMEPLEDLDLHFWWENVTYGYQAYLDYRACLKALASPNAIIGTEAIIGRPDPPQYKMMYVVAGAGAIVTAALVAVKLASDQISLGSFRKGK